MGRTDPTGATGDELAGLGVPGPTLWQDGEAARTFRVDAFGVATAVACNGATMAETDARLTALTELVIGLIAEANSVRGGAVDRVFAHALEGIETEAAGGGGGPHLAGAADVVRKLRGRFG